METKYAYNCTCNKVIIITVCKLYKSDLVGVQEVRWDKGGTERTEDYTFFYRAGNEDHQLGTGFLCIRESYQQLGG
jgi:hypothetical protein